VDGECECFNVSLKWNRLSFPKSKQTKKKSFPFTIYLKGVSGLVHKINYLAPFSILFTAEELGSGKLFVSYVTVYSHQKRGGIGPVDGSKSEVVIVVIL
jgi:hypothetical protein